MRYDAALIPRRADGSHLEDRYVFGCIGIVYFGDLCGKGVRLATNSVTQGSDPSLPKKIAYFVNQYPTVSHSFIRREILALERQGLDILRIAARGWDGDLVDAARRRATFRPHREVCYGEP